MKLTLLQRPGRVNIDDFNNSLKAELAVFESGLSAKAKPSGFSKAGWAQVDVTGEDHEILEELISREFHRAVTALSALELYGNYSGIIRGSYGEHMEVDVGIENPKPVSVNLGLNTLSAQLCDGKLRTLEEMTESYCLELESMVAVRITRLENDPRKIEAWLADSQIESFARSISSNLQRVQIFHCTRPQIDSAVKRMNLERDIVSVENTTLTTHSMICKLGTDAIGLIPKLGSVLRRSVLKPLIPSRITSRCRKW